MLMPGIVLDCDFPIGGKISGRLELKLHKDLISRFALDAYGELVEGNQCEPYPSGVKSHSCQLGVVEDDEGV